MSQKINESPGIQQVKLSLDGVRLCMVEITGRHLQLHTLVVEPAMRRKQWGTQALIHLKKECKRLGLSYIRLVVQPVEVDGETMDKNDLVKFYKKNGFQLGRDGESMFWYA